MADEELLRTQLVFPGYSDDVHFCRGEPLERGSASEASQQQRVRLHLDVIGDDAGVSFGSEFLRHGQGPPVVGIIRIQKGKEHSRVPKYLAAHLSRTTCLSPDPGPTPPLRNAPTSRHTGWSSVNSFSFLVRRRTC